MGYASGMSGNTLWSHRPFWRPGLLGLAMALPVLLAGRVGSAQQPTPFTDAGDPADGGSAFAGAGTEDALDEASFEVPGELVVDLRDDADAGAMSTLARLLTLSFSPTASEPTTRSYIVHTVPGLMATLASSLKRDPLVEYVEPLYRVKALGAPNDPLYKDQWHLDRVGAPAAWGFGIGRGATVAVVDTGIACEDHGPFTKATDLARTQCVTGHNFVAGNEHANDDHGHGTHVAGTIAQSTNNGLGAAGIAFGARLMPIKVLSENGYGTTADVADGIRWAADHGAQVINLSLGGPRNAKVLQSAVDHARAKGAIVVAAAGNSGGPVNFPGACENAFGVSATDSGDALAKFSSRGEGVDLAAPGVNVVQQTICNNGRGGCEQFPSWNGTSMATPHVAGAAALLVSLGVTDPAAVESILSRSARVVDTSDKGRLLYGAGILQADAAARWVTLVQGLARLGAVIALAMLLLRGLRKTGSSLGSGRFGFWVAALATGPGLLFFAPFVLSRELFVVDLLARPVADLDLLIDAGLHRWLPFANVLWPLALAAIGFSVKSLRPVIAGAAVGTAAYLATTAGLGFAYGPFGKTLLTLWCAANALGCLGVARAVLLDASKLPSRR
jgi:serine protease